MFSLAIFEGWGLWLRFDKIAEMGRDAGADAIKFYKNQKGPSNRFDPPIMEHRCLFGEIFFSILHKEST